MQTGPTRSAVALVAFGESPSGREKGFCDKSAAEMVLGGLGSHLSGKRMATGGLWPVAGEETLPAVSETVFNLCDGDAKEGDYGLVEFAQRLEKEGVFYTGGNSRLLAMARDRTLSWIETARTPEWWDIPPEIEAVVKRRNGWTCGHLLRESWVARLETEALEALAAEVEREAQNLEGAEEMADMGEEMGGPLGKSSKRRKRIPPHPDFFYQQLLTGQEYTACFIGERLVGIGFVNQPLEDQDVVGAQERSVRDWQRQPNGLTDVWTSAQYAWSELLRKTVEPGENILPYGTVQVTEDEHGTPHVTEVRPNPPIGPDGLLASCWASGGGAYPTLIQVLATPLRLRTPKTR